MISPLRPTRAENRIVSRHIQSLAPFYNSIPIVTIMEKPKAKEHHMKVPAKVAESRANLALTKEERKAQIQTSSPKPELSAEEITAYTSDSKIVSDGLLTFCDVGSALMRIRDGKLYREEYATFEECCDLKFGLTRSHGYTLIEGAAAVAALPENVQNFVQNLGQAAALAKAPKKKRAKIIKAVAEAGKVTAKAIAATVAKVTKEKPSSAEFDEIVTDCDDFEIPKTIVAEFLRAEKEGKEMLAHAQALKNYLEQDDLTRVESRGLRETAKDLLAGIKTHQTKHVRCPKCEGKKCAVCSKRGFVSKYFASNGMGGKEK